MIDLRKRPFYLNDEDIKWVNDTKKKMTLEEKVKQLFIDMINTSDKETLKQLVNTRSFGGIRYTNKDASTLQDMINTLQEETKIPLLVASNAESGGNGACANGTEIGCSVKISSTGNINYAFELGRVSAIEAKVCGCNITFAPVVDINRNFHNPIISQRSFGSSEITVRDYSLAYLKGAHSEGLACCAKHFPGDGIDERDQHLSYSVNSLSTSEWDKTFGLVYKALIEQDLEAIMVGHIMLPSYEEEFNSTKKYIPATISKAILTNLLREKLDFNGLVITDATHMVGFSGYSNRKDLLVRAINAGCDMLLFYNDFEEDFNYVLDALNNNLIKLSRLDDAITRILGLKAHLKLHKGNNITDKTLLQNVGKPEFKEIAKNVSKDAITLVKNTEEGVLPLTPLKHKKILVVPLESTNMLSKFGSLFNRGVSYVDYFKTLLTNEGFDVTIFESLEKKLEVASKEELLKIMNELYAQKTSISSIKEKYDAVIYLANIGGNGTVQRLNWAFTKGSLDVPWFSHEMPIIFVSLACPFHLFDVPEVKTYINCYDKQTHTLDALVSKLVGKDTFRGVSPVDAFCSREELKL